MTSVSFLAFRLYSVLIRRFSAALLVAALVWCVDGIYQPGYAELVTTVINMPIYGRVQSSDLAVQAEVLAEREINRQFVQDIGVSEIEVVIVGDRDGEIVPILTATVSRTQWQETPEVNAWAQYYISSHALLQRHEEQERGNSQEAVASFPRGSIASSGGQISPTAIERAYREGRLTGEAIQREYLDDLD